ncbi:MarR family transcriptional regulator [Phenylobacterium sp. LjRoot219]|uniref:MarR family winged helix-turn-helix transcriptional regulator n=1 Tax=Phenylobacterium sp. LjRoot219 TaxID=3342283 RepID=UPI003ECF7D64
MTAGRMKFDSMAAMLSFQLPRAAALLKAGVEAELEPLGLRASESTLLIYLGENPGRTQSEAGRDLRVKPANMVPLVARLAAAGLVARVPGEGRALSLHLTEQGVERLGEVRAALQRQEDRISGHLSAQDKTAMLQALATIIKRQCGHED